MRNKMATAIYYVIFRQATLLFFLTSVSVRYGKKGESAKQELLLSTTMQIGDPIIQLEYTTLCCYMRSKLIHEKQNGNCHILCHLSAGNLAFLFAFGVSQVWGCFLPRLRAGGTLALQREEMWHRPPHPPTRPFTQMVENAYQGSRIYMYDFAK
jgi:hypothetical protein